MSWQELPTTSISFGGSSVEAYDPDFAFPREPVQYTIPLWFIGVVAISFTCATAILSRTA